ncbi:VOC family protein [Tepidibacillus marianensis]|uniref:VOC family protein n=1 Tax=Tepidibacillus marianensis TaxID=3131995 RepID=UPI0038633CCD
MPFYKDILGLTFVGRDEVKDEGVRVAFFEIGGTRIELLEALHEESPIYKHIEKREKVYTISLLRLEILQRSFSD